MYHHFLPILISTGNSPTTLEQLAHLAEIIIGIATIYSLWLSRQALKKSDWNSALSTVPSIIIRPSEIYVGVRGAPHESGWGVYQAGIQIPEKEDDQRSIRFNITFQAINAGRGAAFNIKKPKIKSIAEYEEGYRKVPLQQQLTDDPFEFTAVIIKSFKEWKEVSGQKIPIEIELPYTNDQGNVNCTSKWSAEIKPFEIDGTNLVVREERLLNRKSTVAYLPN